ncbi:type II toxin-antitoxin system VapC family toxin [Prosthecobacter sp.]|uniref:type II toxin-antitoxin system VapC family toxin n=1 Tax=Prosthecobacter sp. TaxID=1965333 RepID=UPI00378399FA
MIHLDTSFLIDALVPGSAQEAQIVAWLKAGETVEISAVAWGEFLCGPLSSTAEAFARKLLPVAEPLERSDAEKAAKLFNLTGRRSKTYPDCCIAAVAIRLQASLATSNSSDFISMVPHGLVLA